MQTKCADMGDMGVNVICNVTAIGYRTPRPNEPLACGSDAIGHGPSPTSPPPPPPAAPPQGVIRHRSGGVQHAALL